MRRFFLIALLTVIAAVLVACGGDDNDSNGQSASGDADSQANIDGPLSLSEGQFYIMRATGAINNTYSSDRWGGNWRQRRLYEDGSPSEYWSLRMSATNRVDATEVSVIHVGILKGLAPGTYPLIAGDLLSTPDADQPVIAFSFQVRYPDFQILNDQEEVDGTITIDTISDEGMSGTLNVTLFGEGGEVQVTAIFDVPVVEPFEASQ